MFRRIRNRFFRQEEEEVEIRDVYEIQFDSPDELQRVTTFGVSYGPFKPITTIKFHGKAEFVEFSYERGFIYMNFEHPAKLVIINTETETCDIYPHG